MPLSPWGRAEAKDTSTSVDSINEKMLMDLVQGNTVLRQADSNGNLRVLCETGSVPGLEVILINHVKL